MRNVIFTLLFIVMLVFSSCGTYKGEVRREIVEYRYISEYDGIETDYVYKYNWLKGEFVLVPCIKNIHKDAVYEVLYRITYPDGNVVERWETISVDEFDSLSSLGSVTDDER